MKKHEFGGVWTQKKLAALEAYLNFYSTALKNQGFTLHYVDAFAGTGYHDPIAEDDQRLLIPHEDFRGSVITALEVAPGFDEFHFNDLNSDHVKELQRIKDEYPAKKILIYEKDANEFVPDFCAELRKNDRAVLLLDPYSTQLNWSTIKHVAASEKVDLWLLFPISVILRMTPRDGARTRPEWKHTIDRLLGTDEWEATLYKPVESPLMADLFDDSSSSPSIERINTSELERWVTKRLRELFPYVEEPVLLTNNGRPLFLLYFAVSNKKESAWGLAKRAASHIKKKIDSGSL